MIVGREVERALADILVTEVIAGSPRALVVRGEPGIGKSVLLGHLAACADAAGFLVLSGRASEYERDLPFGAVVDALDAHLATMPVGLPAGVRAELAAVFPALSGGEPALASPVEPHRLHRALGMLLASLAARVPLLLMLDDAHWADAATVELVDHLLRNPPGAPVLLAIALRPQHCSPALLRALHAAERRGGPDTIELGPLPGSRPAGAPQDTLSSREQEIACAPAGP
jgi:predicted ATPase